MDSRSQLRFISVLNENEGQKEWGELEARSEGIRTSQNLPEI